MHFDPDHAYTYINLYRKVCCVCDDVNCSKSNEWKVI